MRTFDENKVVDVFHPGKAVIGGRYFVEDNLVRLKRCVTEEETKEDTYILREINNTIGEDDYPFMCEDEEDYSRWAFLYPYEEPPKKRMTNRQFIEWLAKGNGLYKGLGDYAIPEFSTVVRLLDEEVDKTFLICPFGQTEWIEPTFDIYERDCKKKED